MRKRLANLLERHARACRQLNESLADLNAALSMATQAKGAQTQASVPFSYPTATRPRSIAHAQLVWAPDDTGEWKLLYLSADMCCPLTEAPLSARIEAARAAADLVAALGVTGLLPSNLC